MDTFLTRFAALVTGVLCGFDRLFFRASLRNLVRPFGLQNYLWANRILFKDFARHSEEVTDRLEAASLRQARQLGREVRYLNTSEVRKDDLHEMRVTDQAVPELAAGEVLLRIERFALSANNVTYARLGDSAGYWQFYPGQQSFNLFGFVRHMSVLSAGKARRE